MLSKIYSSGVLGIDGFEVTVECSAWDRIPKFELVGLPDAAVKEAKNRVRSACENSGFTFPPLDIMINLAPGFIALSKAHIRALSIIDASSTIITCSSRRLVSFLPKE